MRITWNSGIPEDKDQSGNSNIQTVQETLQAQRHKFQK